MVYARRTDTGHAAIRKALRKIGCTVYDTSRVGKGFPDLVARLGWRFRFFEVKSPGGELTEDQQEFYSHWKDFVRIVETPEEAVREMCQ